MIEKDAHYEPTPSRETAASEERIPFDYGEVIVKNVNYHRGTIPIVSGFISLDITPDTLELYEFFENFFYKIGHKPRGNIYDYIDWLTYYLDLPPNREDFRFSTTYTEFLYIGGPDYGYHLNIEYLDPDEYSPDCIEDFIVKVMNNAGAENVPKRVIRQSVDTLYRAVQNYVDECNKYLASAEKVIEEYVSQL